MSIEAVEPRLALATASAAFYARQPEIVVAVTGTNGKSSTVDFLRQIWVASGLQAASMGTLGAIGPQGHIDLGHTTPDPVAILGPGEEGRRRPPKSLPGILHGRGRRSGTPRPSRRTCRGQRPTPRGRRPAPTAPALGGCGTAGPQPDIPRSGEPGALAMDPDRPFGPFGARVLRCSSAGRGCGLGPHGGPAPREQCPDGVSPTDAWGFLPQCPSPGAGGRLGGVSP